MRWRSRSCVNVDQSANRYGLVTITAAIAISPANTRPLTACPKLSLGEQQRGGDERDHDRAVGVLQRRGEPDARAAREQRLRAPGAQHDRRRPQRQRARQHARPVVERQPRVEDRQERDGHDRRGDQPGTPAEPLAPGGVGGGDGADAEGHRDHARPQEHGARVVREPLLDAAEVDHRQPRRQQVRQRGRVDEVAGVEVPAGHRHRVRDEVRALVEVVGVRQPVAEAPEPQRRRDHQDQREDERGRVGAPRRLGRRRGRVFMRRAQSASEASHAALSRRAARARSRRRAAPCRPARPRCASRARRAHAAPSRCRSRAG